MEANGGRHELPSHPCVGEFLFGAQAYATLVSYVQYQGTWYVESMSILSIDTPSVLAR